MAFALLKDEANGTRLIAFWACFFLTLGLALVSLYGVWMEPGHWFGKLLWSIPIVAAEFLVAVALQRAILAPNLHRKIAGVIVFLMLAFFCVGNVERGVHRIYSDVFDQDTQQLRDLANLAGTQSTNINTAATKAVDSIPVQLERTRTEVAKLEVELTKITNNTTASSIKAAQAHLQGLSYYDGNIDGLWEEKTREAVLRRGNEIRTEMVVKNNVIKGLEGGAQVTTTATASEGQDKTKIENEAKARKREAFGQQVILGAWTLESARSLGWIVFISGLTIGVFTAAMKLREDIELQKLQNELDGLKGGAKAPEPEPTPVPEPEIAPPPPIPESPVAPEPIAAQVEPPEPTLTDAQRRARAGGLGNAQNQAAARAKAERLILVPSFVARDAAEAEAAKVAAQ